MYQSKVVTEICNILNKQFVNVHDLFVNNELSMHFRKIKLNIFLPVNTVLYGRIPRFFS